MRKLLRTAAVFLALWIFLLALKVDAAPRALGAAIVIGPAASANGAVLSSGTTIFDGDRITTGANTTFAVRMPNARVVAAPGTTFHISNNRVFVSAGLVQMEPLGHSATSLAGPGFKVTLVLDQTVPAVELSVTAREARVLPVRGSIHLNVSGYENPISILQGQVAVLALPDSASSPQAGHVAGLLPTVTIHRGAQQIAAATKSTVEWHDELRSGRGGRARIALNDGSVLSLGSESSLRVAQHDPAAQQTELHLNYGRLRSRVQRLVQPAARFNVKTPAATAGVIGTDFYLFATPTFTEILVFEGQVRLTFLSGVAPATAGAGQKVILHSDGRVEGPSRFTLAERDAAQRLTSDDKFRLAHPVWFAVISGAGTGIALGLGKVFNDRESPN